MKRFLCILLVAVALVGLTTTVASAEEYATVVSENGYGVRMREGPGKAYRVTSKYDVGTTVIVQQRGSGWSQIKVGETVGWMMNQFLRFGATGTGTGTGDAGGGVGTGTVTSDNGLRVWLRATAGGKRIALYRPGTAVTILAYGNTWHHISIGGVRGYMMSKYIAETPQPKPSSKAIEAVGVNYPAPVVDDVLEARVTPSEATVSYSWVVEGLGEQSKTSSLRVLNKFSGKKITLVVKGTGVYYGSKQYVTDAVVSSRRVTDVSLSKEQPFVGDTLTANVKPSSATVTYSWRVGGNEVSTESSYTVSENDLGKMIQLKVTGYDTFSGVAVCSASGNVLSNRELYSVSMSVKDRPVLVGEVLTSTLLPAGSTGSYAWMADGAVVATTASYKVTGADLGKKLSLRVTGTSPYSGTVNASAYGYVKQGSISAVALSNKAPAAGDVIRAVLTPAQATASYQWFATDANGAWKEISSATGPSYAVTEAEAGRVVKVRVRAGDNSLYTIANANGYLDSAATAAVISGKRIAGVQLNNTAPVVGDEIIAVLTPARLNAEARDKGLLSFVWTVGNETYVNSTGKHTVAATDAGKTISVRAVGANGYTGDVTSPASKAVASSAKLTGAGILIAETKANAASTAPQVGQTLSASVAPASAVAAQKVLYTWKVDNQVIGSGPTLPVTAAHKGKQITLSVKGVAPYYETVSATTAAAVQYTAMNATFGVAQPRAGAAPQTAVGYAIVNAQKKQETICTGSIQWIDQATGAVAEMDSKGHFKPGTTYIARLTLTAKAGYGWVGASVKINGAAARQLTPGGNVFDSAPFQPTGNQTISRFYISGVSRPVPGGVPTITEYETDQYTASIDWGASLDADGKFRSDLATFTATITLKPNAGYTVTGLGNNLFTVSNADATSSVADAASNTVKVTATFNITRTLTVTAERATANLDGVKAVIIQCFADLSNMTAPPKPEDYAWNVRYAQSNNTWVDKTGKLNVGEDEYLDRDLVVEASITTGGKTYTGSTTIRTVSGSEADTAIAAVFSSAPTSVAAGGQAQYTAYATNSMLGVGWGIEYNTSQDTKIKDGLLTVGQNETAPSINVIAYPLEAPGNIVRTNVKITHNLTVTYRDELGKLATETYSGLNNGDKTPDFKAPTNNIPGFTFVGWAPKPTPTVTGDTVYTAQWRANAAFFRSGLMSTKGITITYTDGVDGEEVFADQLTAGLVAGAATPAFSGTPAREGYDFAGWEPAVAETVSADATYTAKWQLKKPDATFTVTYTDGVDGEEVFADQSTAGLAGEAATPAFNGIPERAGYEFAGWQPAVAETVTADATYTAKWIKAYRVVFRDGTEANAVMLDQRVAEGENTPLPRNPVYEGHDFDGWFDQDGNGWGDSLSKPVTRDVTYTARWRAHDGADAGANTLEAGNAQGLTVILTNGVDGAVLAQTTCPDFVAAYEYASTVTPPAHPTDAAMTFNGWDESFDADAMTLTFTALWTGGQTPEEALYTVVYTDGVDGEEVFADQTAAGLSEGSATPNFSGTPVREGYTFAGWAPAVADVVTADAVYTAQWTGNDAQEPDGLDEGFGQDGAAVFQVICKNGVDGGVLSQTTCPDLNAVYGYISQVAIPAHPTDPGMAFDGWSENMDAEALTVTFTAQWKPAEANAPAEDGQPAEGEQSNGGEQPTGGEQPAADGQPALYTVTYTDGMGGTLVSQQAEEGAATPKYSETPLRELYVFTGWSPAVADTVTADATYDAQWADDWNGNGIPDADDAKYKVVYKDGDTVLKESEVLAGMDTPGCAAPEREGKLFAGWQPAVAGSVTDNATYVAQWSEPEKKDEQSADKAAAEETAAEAEPDDETLEKAYEEQAKASNISISFDKGAGKIGRGKSSTYTVKVGGVPEGVQADISWRLSGKDLTATKGAADGSGFRVSVGEDEKAETLRIVVTVKVGDITVSRGRRISIVAPSEQPEEEKKPEATQPVKEGAAEQDTSKQATNTPAPTQTPAPSEEEMGQNAMEEGNKDIDPALVAF